jgi:hypothetical protein
VFLVTRVGSAVEELAACVVIMRPPAPAEMLPDNIALNLAAWIVSMVPHGREQLEILLRDVEAA